MFKKLLLALSLFLCAAAASAQTVQTLLHQPPDGAGIAFLLTDGSVMTQGNNLSDWWKLVPDQTGSYANGTWSKLASLPAGYLPDAFASAVLADGRVIIEGGEYNNGNFTLTNLGTIYDPIANKWTAVAPPSGWANIGDSPSAVLPNGHFLIGNKLTKQLAELDPATMTWTHPASTGKKDFDAEEGWTLLPDGTILTYDVKSAPNSERYDPLAAKWTTAGSTIVDLHSPTTVVGCIPFGHGQKYCPPGEVGPGILRPDGTVFATGSASNNNTGPGHTAIYHPSSNSWTVGPDFPSNDNAGDNFAVLLPSGNVLVAGDSGANYEFNGKTLTHKAVADFTVPILMLPTGEAMIEGSQVELYVPTGTYAKSWAPAITKHPSAVTRGTTYSISGKQFNGLSQAAAFGDEFQTATNYPLVRITNHASGHVVYARTHGHSTMGVATGATIVSTNFDVPATTETGASSLQVIANGIPSAAVTLTVK